MAHWDSETLAEQGDIKSSQSHQRADRSHCLSLMVWWCDPGWMPPKPHSPPQVERGEEIPLKVHEFK